MGLFSGIGIAGFMLLVSGLITTSSLVTGVIYCFNKFEDYSCGKLNYGILIGVATLLPLLFNFMLYAISCIKKISLILPLFLVMCSSAINIYLTDNLSHKCLDHYKEDNPKLWSFYIYFIVAQLSIIILTMVLFSVAK